MGRAVDAFGRAAFLLLPESEGFSGSTTAYSAGVRVGIFREGFTIPGVSISLSRRFLGDVDLGTSGDPSSVTVDPSVTSFRATAGKDLFAVEWLAGFGVSDPTGQLWVLAVLTLVVWGLESLFQFGAEAPEPTRKVGGDRAETTLQRDASAG